MKKFTAILLTIVLCLGILTGCGSNYTTEESTLFVLSNGKVITTDVEAFDTSLYDEDGLKAYVQEQIDAYTLTAGKGTVKMKKLTVADGEAVLTMEYATVSDYQKFSGMELFSGSVAEALLSGYSFDGGFVNVSATTPVEATSSDFIPGDGYKVLVVKANTNVKVNGTIAYVSAKNVSLVDSSTISIKEGNSINGIGIEPETQAVEPETEVDSDEVITEEAPEGSVSEDDLLAAPEEEEVVFEFDEEEDTNTSEFSSVYTYIIYK